MKAYLAGPGVFAPDSIAFGNGLKAVCAALGFEGMFPVDENVPSHPHSETRALMIARANEALIRDCDVVIADMTPFRGPSMDIGTGYEMGYAAGLGKPVFAYTHSVESYPERMLGRGGVDRGDGTLVDEDGWSIENFGHLPDNLMVAFAAQSIHRTFREAAIAAMGWSMARRPG